MTYDHWKTTEQDDGAERPPEQKGPELNQSRTPLRLANFIDEMAAHPEGGKMAAIAYKKCSRLIREWLCEEVCECGGPPCQTPAGHGCSLRYVDREAVPRGFQVTLAEARERLRDALEAMRITKRDAAIRENELIVALAAQEKIIAAVKAERDAIRAKTIEECANVALEQPNSITIFDMIRNLPLTIACSAAMQLGYLIGSVVTG